MILDDLCHIYHWISLRNFCWWYIFVVSQASIPVEEEHGHERQKEIRHVDTDGEAEADNVCKKDDKSRHAMLQAVHNTAYRSDITENRRSSHHAPQQELVELLAVA